MYGLSDEEIAPTPPIGESVAKALKKENGAAPSESLIDYARYNENFVLVATSSCCIRWNSTGYQGRSPWLVSTSTS
jgi:hypothetical protein